MTEHSQPQQTHLLQPHMQDIHQSVDLESVHALNSGKVLQEANGKVAKLLAPFHIRLHGCTSATTHASWQFHAANETAQ